METWRKEKKVGVVVLYSPKVKLHPRHHCLQIRDSWGVEIASLSPRSNSLRLCKEGEMEKFTSEEVGLLQKLHGDSSRFRTRRSSLHREISERGEE